MYVCVGGHEKGHVLVLSNISSVSRQWKQVDCIEVHLEWAWSL